MMSERLFRFFAICAVVGSSQGAFSIGVGDITVSSYVNEPLSASIAIIEPKELSESEVIASLAPLEDFERLGVERHYSLSALSFETDFSSPRSAIVNVSTVEPVREPYLNFLVELKWPEGRLLREYTVFLDLPSRQTTQKLQPDRGSSRSRLADKALTPNEYRVAPNDTLGAIAARFKGDGVSIDQMMLAIKDANPGKFLRNNINGIRAGVLLNIPSSISESISPRVAAQQVVDQWNAWKAPSSARGLRIVADNELETLNERPPSVSAENETTPVNDETFASSVLENAGNQFQSTMLPAEADNSLANVEARLAILSEQLMEIQGVVAAKDQEIAALRTELANRPVAGAKELSPKVVVPSEPRQAQSANNAIAWGLLVILLAAVVFLMRRRVAGGTASASESTDSPLSGSLDSTIDELLPVPSQRGAARKSSDADASKGYGESLLTGYAADQTMADAIAEADIYVAYGRHQHALDTLEAASAAESSNAMGLLKMLEIYISLDRIEEAQSVLSAIEETGDRESASKAGTMLSGISVVLQGDDASKALANGPSTSDEGVTSEVNMPAEMDASLDLEFQAAANSEPSDGEEADASGMLDNDEDPAETALELARAYLDMGDKAGAKELLDTAISMGDDAQVEIAKQLLVSIE